MIVDINKVKDTLHKVRKGELKQGLKIGVPEIDKYIRFKEGLSVILGHANVGKTQLMIYLMFLYTLKHKLRWLVFSSENEAYQLLQKLIEFDTGLPINLIPEDDFNERLKHLTNYFKFIDPNSLYTYKMLLNEAKVIKDAWDYNGLLIDPYNSLVAGKDVRALGKHEYDYLATTEMRQFCSLNNIAIWLNTHANTEALRKIHAQGHEYQGHPIPPMAADVEGGGKFVNRADQFYVIHRYTQHETDWMYSHLHVRKVKNIDTGGMCTVLDNPIQLRSIRNNVGYSIDGENIVTKIKSNI